MIKKLLLSPIERFVNSQSFSGILLFGATIIALIWANSPWGASYHELFDYKVGVTSETFELSKPLILWINDGLMALFFLMIGLEIKREVLIGELNSVRNAALPFFAAIGGMGVPVLFYVLLNQNPDASHGWGIPMATDIAFSLAILKLLGNRVPLALKVFLTAFAIVDDIGAVLVVAIFYSTELQLELLLGAAIPLAILGFMGWRGYYSKYIFIILGIVVWVFFLKSGVHPTVAGILLAFTVPIRQRVGEDTYAENLCEIADDFNASQLTREGPLLSKDQINAIDNLVDWAEKVQSPLQLLENKLHKWSAYFIMPVFALSNAGVDFMRGGEIDYTLAGVLALALIFGNLIGVSILTFSAVKLKLAVLPDSFGKSQVVGVALLAGVGFTMSMFIANLAFADHPELMDSSKVGILVGSLLSGLLGYLVLRIAPAKKQS